MTAVHYTADVVLFEEAEPSRFVYRLISGEAEVSRRGADGVPEVLGRISAGEYVGEMGVLAACPRTATARFTTDSVVEVLTRRRFLDELARDPAMSSRVLHALSLRTRSQVHMLERGLASLPPERPRTWFANLLEAVRAFLKPTPVARGSRAVQTLPGIEERVVGKGSHLFREGEPSDHVLWIRSGRVHILKGGKRVGHARAGEFVGEMGVLESLPRSADVVATTQVVVRLVPATSFFQLMQESPSAYLTVLDSLCERAHRLRNLTARHADPEAPVGNIFSLARSMESVAQLAEQRVVDETHKLKRFFGTQMHNGRYVASVYQKHMRGDASREEMDRANGFFRDYLKMAGLGTLLILPGAPLTIPLAVKIGKALGVDIMPADAEIDHLREVCTPDVTAVS